MGLAACGGGDDNKPSSTVEGADRAPTTGQTTPEDLPARPVPPTSPSKPPPTTTSPENQPGGGGDEEPARTEVRFVATSAGIKPRQAGVASYISVRVTLVSKDGSSRKLTIGGRTLSVGGTRKSEFVTLPGLRPGRSYMGHADDGTTVRVLSLAEPGP